jgi:signal transduction histidine kinase
MRLTARLTLVFIACVALVLTLNGAWWIHQESLRIEADARHDALEYGRSLVELLRLYRDEHGEEATRALLDRFEAPQADVQLRWVRLEGGGGGSDAPLADPGSLRAGGAHSVVDRAAPGGGRLLTYLPLDGPRGASALELSESLAKQVESFQVGVQRVALTALATALALGLLAAWTGVRLVGRPMHELVVLARRIGQGDLSQRLALAQRDEVGELAREMNLMCDRLLEARQRLERETAARIEALERLRQADRLATVGQLAAGVAHELGTPLSVIQGRADLLAGGGLEPGEVEENGRIIGGLARRMATTIRQVLDYARPRPADKSEHDLVRVARRVQEMLRHLAEQARVELHIDAREEPLVASVDVGKLEQVLTNLIVNGIHSMPAGGRLELRLSRRRGPVPGGADGQPRELVCVEVVDQGEGISPEHMGRLWEPFFTTKAVGHGTGLGLPIARGLVAEHGGCIEVQSEIGQGSTFRVLLPRGGEG